MVLTAVTVASRGANTLPVYRPEILAEWDQRLADARRVLGEVYAHTRLHGAGVPDELLFAGVWREFAQEVPADMAAFVAAAAIVDRIRPPVHLGEPDI